MNCMASTSPQSSSPLPSCLEKPLPLDGFQGTPDEVEQQWYDQVYLGSGDRMKQLTWRAVIVGMLLGSILSLTNLYANLKMGWSFGVALTAGINSQGGGVFPHGPQGLAGVQQGTGKPPHGIVGS